MFQPPDYPSTFLRGIPNTSSQFFDNQGNVTGYIFRPRDDQEVVGEFYKQSINWEDDNTVESFMLSETNAEDNSIRYRGGVARVSREKVDLIKQEPPYLDAVDYDREPIEADPSKSIRENHYHGNLLLNKSRVDNRLFRKALFSRLKLTIIEVVPSIENEA